MNKDLITILLVDGISIFIVLFTALTSSYILKEKNKTNVLLKSMIGIIFAGSLVDVLSYVFDLNYGVFNTASIFNDVIIYITCSLLRVFLITGLVCFNFYFNYRFNGKIDKEHLIAAIVIVVISIVSLIINIFTPFVFDVADSKFSRGGFGYYLFYILSFIILLDALIYYIYARIKGGLLKFFPVWFFLIPMELAAIVQYFLPDISTIWIGAALTVDFLFMALQNDTIFRDKLTKLYNRVFLDSLKKAMERSKKNKNFTAMMLDLNGFKLINDNFGHHVGDQALIITGDLLREAVGTYGAVIRFAGDEFIVILNTQNDELLKKLVDNIYTVFDNFNNSGKEKYQLSIALGYSKVDLKNSSIDEIMKDIDAKMYLDKQEMHKLHPEWDRK